MWFTSIKRRLPFLVHPVRWSRWLDMHLRFPLTTWRLERSLRGRVTAGPFKGMRFPIRQRGDYGKLLGIYEKCLVPTIDDVIARKPRHVIDVGAEYGYYALGFAMRLPESEVIAYEMDDTRLAPLRRNRSINRLDHRVVLRGECTVACLTADLADKEDVFVLMDIEGGEADLLDPERVAGLVKAEMLVELHEMFVPGVTKLLRERFAATHEQHLIKVDR